MSLLLALAGAVVDPPAPPPSPAIGGGGAWLGMPAPRPAVDTSAADRDMRDIQTIITALFALNRIF